MLPFLTAAMAAEPATVEAGPGQGLTVTAADDRFSMNVRARFQLRESLSLAEPEADGARDVTLQTQLYTTRLSFAGHVLSEDIGYRIQLAVAARDYRDGTISPVYDAYLDLRANPNLSLRVGQLFVPFDRLRTIREFALQLPDRPRVVSELTLDRDIGVYAYSDHLGGERSPLAYRIGVFGGSGIHQLDAHPPGGLFVARFELRPLGPIDDDSEGDLERRSTPGLALGAAAAYNVATTRARSTTSTVYLAGTTDYVHLAADAVFKWRGFAFEGEVVVREAGQDRIRGQAEDGTPLIEHTRSGWGVVAQPSVMLTDHVEVAARYGRLGAAPGTDPAFLEEASDRANELAAGASVYLNDHWFKVQIGATTLFGDGDAPTAGDVAAHALVDLTF
jgi:hypothetical protein